MTSLFVIRNSARSWAVLSARGHHEDGHEWLVGKGAVCLCLGSKCYFKSSDVVQPYIQGALRPGGLMVSLEVHSMYTDAAYQEAFFLPLLRDAWPSGCVAFRRYKYSPHTPFRRRARGASSCSIGRTSALLCQPGLTRVVFLTQLRIPPCFPPPPYSPLFAAL